MCSVSFLCSPSSTSLRLLRGTPTSLCPRAPVSARMARRVVERQGMQGLSSWTPRHCSLSGSSVWSVLWAAPGCSPVQRRVCQDQASHGVSVAVSAPALGCQPLPHFVSPCSCKLTPHSCPSRSNLWFSLCALLHPANRSLRVPRVAYCASVLFQAPLCSPSYVACDAGRLGRLDLLCKFVVPLPCCCPGPSLAPPSTVYVLSLSLPLCWPGHTQHSSGFDRNVGRSC